MRMKSAGRSREQDGIALVIVLGILSILLILGIAFATALRTDQIAGRNNIDSLRAKQMVDTAISRAMDYLDMDSDPDLDGQNFLLLAPRVVPASGRTAGSGGTKDKADFLDGTGSMYLPPDLITVLEDPATHDPEWERISISGGSIAAPALTGRIAFIACDISGYVDGSVAGGSARNHGVDVSEIDLMDVRDGQFITFASQRQSNWGAFDTRPDVEMLANPLLVDGENKLMQPYSLFPSNYWNTALDRETVHFDFQGTVSGINFDHGAGSDSTEAQDAMIAIGLAIAHSGVDLSVAGNPEKLNQLAANIRDYIDGDNVPCNGEFSSQMPVSDPGRLFTNRPRLMQAICTEAVPMLNEVMLKHTLDIRSDGQIPPNTVVTSIIEVMAETWIPFHASSSPDINRYEVELRDLVILGMVPAAAPADLRMRIQDITLERYAGSSSFYDVHQLDDPARQRFSVTIPNGGPSPAFGNSYGVVEIAVIEKATGEVVDQLVFEVPTWANDLGLPPDPIPYGTHEATLYREANDPRINWRWEPGPDPATDHWGDGSGTMGSPNQRMTDYFSSNGPEIIDGTTLMYVRNGPMESIGELGQLLYDEDHPWKTIRLLGPDPESTANMVEHFAPPAGEKGFINLNSDVEDVLASAFVWSPVRSVPGQPIGTRLTTNDARMVEQVLLNNGIATNTPQVLTYTNRATLAERVSSTHLMNALPMKIPDAATAENLVSDAYGLLGTRQNLYTVMAIAEVFAPKSTNVVAEKRAVALVWRDPLPVQQPNGEYHHEMFVRNLVWLDE